MSTQIQQAVSPYGNQDAGSAFYKWLILGLLVIDAYHIWTYSFHHVSGANNGAVIIAFVIATALSMLAFIIKPATIMFVNAVRHEDPMPVKWFWGVIVLLLMIGVWTATASSQNTLSEKKTNHSDTHESRISTLEAKKLSADSMLKSATAMAANMDSNDAESYLAAAEMRHSRAMVKIAEQRTELLGNKPLKQAHGAEGVFSLSDNTHNAIFGLFITLSAVVATIFYTMHIKSEHRIPAFSLAKKLNHDWSSNSENFRSSNFSVNPLKGIFNGVFFGHKEDVIKEENRINDPRVINGDAPPASHKNTESDAVPATQKEDLSVHFGGSEYTLSELKKHRAIYNVDGCPVAFVSTVNADGYLILIPSPDESEWIYKSRTPHADTLAKLIKNKVSSSEFTAATLRWHELNGTSVSESVNSQENKKFTANSSGINKEKQRVTSDTNSSRIEGEFEANSENSEIHHNSLAEVAESDGQISRNKLLDNLMKLAHTDDAEKKLEAISKTIDQLSSDPMNDGLLFSPTKTKNELNLSYERVKALFSIKQKDGKISMTKPFKIVYKAG